MNAQEMLGCFSGEKCSWNSGQSLNLHRLLFGGGFFDHSPPPGSQRRMQNVIYLLSTNVTRGAEAQAV